MDIKSLRQKYENNSNCDEEFLADLLGCVIETFPIMLPFNKSKEIVDFCWDREHTSGYNEAIFLYEDLVNLLTY